MPVFSIIVPVYKTEKYLDKCVTSILSQNYTDFELILVDDGSPDNCPRLCDSYAARDGRVKVIHKENGGVSSARNFGINAATGDYIWFVDSDDYIEPFSLQQLSQAINNLESDLYVFNDKGKREVFNGRFEDLLEKYYFTYVLGFEPWNKLYSGDVIRKNALLFDTEETVGEDLLFNLTYYNAVFQQDGARRLFFIGQDYYTYIDRVGSALNTASKGRLVQQMRLFDKIEKMVSETINKGYITYFFWMHLISGIGQAAQGGLTSKEFSSCVDFGKYKNRLNSFKIIKRSFFKNEKASVLGRMRIQLFVFLMQHGIFRIAGKVMGLK